MQHHPHLRHKTPLGHYLLTDYGTVTTHLTRKIRCFMRRRVASGTSRIFCTPHVASLIPASRGGEELLGNLTSHPLLRHLAQKQKTKALQPPVAEYHALWPQGWIALGRLVGAHRHHQASVQLNSLLCVETTSQVGDELALGIECFAPKFKLGMRRVLLSIMSIQSLRRPGRWKEGNE